MRLRAWSKYRNKKVELDGYKFPSKKEAARYQELKLQEKAGLIKDLVVHKRFEIWVKDVKVCSYESDFSYWKGNEFITEDVKGFKTPVYQIKKKLMKAALNIEIHEV
jgi:hypothetical protein